MFWPIFLIILGIILIIILFSSIKIVRQSTAVVVERLGKYHKTLTTGFHMVTPFIDRCRDWINLKEQVLDFKPQPVITKDNVTMQIDTVVYIQITDPKLYEYGVDRPLFAIENLTATTLRNIVGELELDETLTSRDTVNAKMRIILDEATDPWGIKVNRVELKNILPPRDIQDAMEKQMRAERERREKILQAEGEKKSTVLVAEGKKAAAILDAEAEKEANILRAEGQKAALIAEAEGSARAIELINNANPTAAYVTLQGYEALKVMANGESTKIIVPSELQNVSGLLTSVTEIIKDKK
ncbi:MAG: SPFH/Band 7/PHB domain protein [Clostridiales bacterium]|nr:SPFH/Band 7/PHB domain protein [Clostridiales bacterium]MDD7505946.1 SPFH/Band 7/PHB domain protein [Clostridiales bacterium]MDY5726333.1 SPFH domain-containing protein [Eubacteriales bacterium]